MRVLRLSCKKLVRFAHTLRASLRTIVNYFSVIDQNKQINSIYLQIGSVIPKDSHN